MLFKKKSFEFDTKKREKKEKKGKPEKRDGRSTAKEEHSNKESRKLVGEESRSGDSVRDVSASHRSDDHHYERLPPVFVREVAKDGRDDDLEREGNSLKNSAEVTALCCVIVEDLQ